MIETIWATDGMPLLVIGAVLAGLVRGFSGFGTAMVFLPFAAEVYDPVWVLITLLIIDCFGPIPAVPRAWREGAPKDLTLLLFGTLLGLPVGLAVLDVIPQTTFRYVIAAITLTLLVTLVKGIRYPGAVGRPLILGTGVVAGLCGGAAALPGPPVIFFYMARALPVAVIRANILLYLFLVDLLMIAVLALRGMFEWQPMLTGLMITPIYLVSILVGVWLFDPQKESVYRWVAYAVIAGSALRGLPIWGA